MKAAICVSLLALSVAAFGQRAHGSGGGTGQGFGHGFGRGFSPAAPQPINSIPPVAPIPPLGMSIRNGSRFSNRRGGNFFGGFPFLPGDFGYGYGYPEPYYPPAPNIIVIAPMTPAPPPAPPTPVRPEIKEYNQTAAAAPPPAQAQQPPTFAIVLKDGSVKSAVAVSAQDNELRYVDPDGRHLQIALDMVDRDATTRMNRDRGLRLQLPPPEAPPSR
ncbi:MAG TPA: hypothetical protein VFW83_04450 [Bryobacteraceae bacterium]|nr:hypothetical protein [Bryobacteraceae bacterium]